jgi:hypothetical protein
VGYVFCCFLYCAEAFCFFSKNSIPFVNSWYLLGSLSPIKNCFLSLYLEEFSLVVSKFQVSHESIWSILSWFAYRVSGRDLVSVFYVWYPVFPEPFVEEVVIFSIHVFGIFVKNHVAIALLTYLWIFWFTPVVHVSSFFWQYHAVFVTIIWDWVLWYIQHCFFMPIIALVTWGIL